ncbi:MAG: aldolase/citrate lyase family protein [Actinomycetota bacterium]
MADLRHIWNNGGVALGAWIMLREPLLAEAAARAGYDFVCVDLQHGACDFEHLASMVQAIELGGSTPLARVPWNEPWMIGRALDNGTAGVIVPMVNTAEEAAAAVAACRYAPDGSRSVGSVAASGRHPNYVAEANQHVLCIVMIETMQAVANIDEILSVPGIDAVYIGPADLSLTLGLRGTSDQTDPRFYDALQIVVHACHHHGVVPGIHGNAAVAARRVAAGFQLMSVTSDHGPAQAAFVADLASSRPS